MNAPATLLLLAYAFPPENVSGAARPARFCKYLPDFGVTPRVVTATEQPRLDESIAFVRDSTRDAPQRSLAWHAERVVRKLLLPGEMGLTWSRGAAAKGCEILRGQPRAAVLSTSPPTAAHFAALMVKRRLGIPWIADFRDPMNPTGRIDVARTNVYSMLESFVFRHADAVIANTDVMQQRWAARYPRQSGKLHVVWNGFDPADPVAAAPLPHRPYKHVVHVGELYGSRQPFLILASLRRLLERRLLEPGRVRLSLIGPATDATDDELGLLQGLVDDGVVEYVPHRVPVETARKAASEADVLLLLQPHTDVQVPAKLFEYIRFGRPVLALIRRGSPSQAILERSGVRYRAIFPDDAPARVDAAILETLALPTEPVAPSAWYAQQFDAREQAATLAALVDSLLAAPRAA